MWAFILIIGLCFYGAHHYRLRIDRLKNAEELRAEVLSWNQYTGWGGRTGWKYYELIVRAENGRTYKIQTDNSKARKYKKRTDIVILVPEGAQSAEEAAVPHPPETLLSEHAFFQKAEAEGHAAEVEPLRRSMQMLDSMASVPMPQQPQYLVPKETAVAIKEAAERPWNYWFLLISGIVFSLIFVVCIIGALVDYMQ